MFVGGCDRERASIDTSVSNSHKCKRVCGYMHVNW